MKCICILGIIALTIVACSKELVTPVCDGSKPVYNTDIKSIIDATCLSVGCHNTNSKNGDWTTYNKLKPVLDNGSFKNRIITKQDMPKGGSLSQSEINLMQCWIDNGYTEN